MMRATMTGESTPRRTTWPWALPLLAAVGIGAIATVHPVAAILLVGMIVIGAFALRDVSILVGATLFLHIVGERQGFSNTSLSLGGINLFPNDLLTLALLIAVTVRWMRDGHTITAPRGLLDWSVWLFLGYGLLSMVRSMGIHGWAAVLSFRLQFLYSLLFVLVRETMRDERARVRLARVILIGAAVVGCQGIWNAVTGNPVGAVTSTGTRRYLSGLQAMSIFFGLTVLAGGVWPKRRPLWSIALAGLYLIGILLSQARSVWLGALMGVGTVAFAGTDLRRHGVKLLVTVGLVIITLLLALPHLASLPVIGDIYTRLTSFQELDRDATSLWRLVVWTSALMELRADPIFGLGLGKRFVYWDVVKSNWDNESQMHNSYLELAYYSGAIGVGLLILFQSVVLVYTLRAARRAVGTARAARLQALAASQVCLYAVAFTNVIGSSMTAATFCWILAALSVLEADAADRAGASPA